MSIELNGTTGVSLVQDGTITESKISTGAVTDTKLTLTPNSQEVKDALNASGNAPIYACRAWVNFKGTGTVAIRSSGNVSSITDNGTGHYTVNLATDMQDVNYSAVGMAGGDTNNLINVSHNEVTYPQTTTACRFTTTYQNATPYDAEVVSIGIFR